MKAILKDILFFILNTFRSNLDNGVSILMYHSVWGSAFFTVKKENLERQLKYLRKKNFIVIKLSLLLKKIKNKEDVSNHVCLTLYCQCLKFI